jgi:predicted phage-related endonuclease
MQFDRTQRTIRSRDEWLLWREKNLGASEVAAMFDVHPHVTALQLWAHHRGEAKRDGQDNAAMRRGRIFERAVLSAYQEERPELYIWPGEEYHEIPALRLGATPDAWCGVSEEGRTKQLIQIKTITPGKFDNEWQDGPPVHYLMQLQAELLATGAKLGRLVAMVMDGWQMPVHEYLFEADGDYQAALVGAVERFWQQVASGERPEAKAGDQETLQRLHPDHIAGSAIALGGMPRVRDAIERMRKAQARLGGINKTIEECKAIVCEALGNHQKGILPGFVVSWTTVREGYVPGHTHKGYRRLTISKERGE